MYTVITYFIHALVSIFAVMNPLGIMPTFLALTSGYTSEEKRHTAKRAVLFSFIILVLFLFLGNTILHVFSVTIHAFRVAGGILLFGIAYNLLNAKSSQIQSPSDEERVEKDDISVTPLAIPIIAGPGTITTVMALAAGPGFVDTVVPVFVAFTVVLVSAFVIFYYSAWIHDHLSQATLNVITRLMGFILSIIAIQMAAAGLGGLFPGWL